MELKIKYVLLRFASHIFFETKRKKIKKKVLHLVAGKAVKFFS